MISVPERKSGTPYLVSLVGKGWGWGWGMTDRQHRERADEDDVVKTKQKHDNGQVAVRAGLAVSNTTHGVSTGFLRL